jgi:hypothetical protein
MFVLAVTTTFTACKSVGVRNNDQSVINSSDEKPEEAKKESFLNTVAGSVTGVVEGASNLAGSAVQLTSGVAVSAFDLSKNIAGAAVDVTSGAISKAADFVGLSSDKNSKWSGIVTRQPYQHVLFTQSINPEVAKIFPVQASRMFSRQEELTKYSMLYGVDIPSEQLKEYIFIAVSLGGDDKADHIKISRVDEGADFIVEVTELVPAFGCGLIFPKKNFSSHLIKIAKNRLLDGASSLNKKVVIRHRSEVEYCPRPYAEERLFTSENKVKYRRHYRSYDQNNFSDVLVSAFPMSDQWGQWDLFKRMKCGDCDGLEEPTGYPDRLHLLAINDQMDFSQKKEARRKLKIINIYQSGDYLLVDARREVTLCSQKDAKKSHSKTLEVLTIGHDELENIDHLKKEKILFPGPFIAEDQILCPKNSEE